MKYFKCTEYKKVELLDGFISFECVKIAFKDVPHELGEIIFNEYSDVGDKKSCSVSAMYEGTVENDELVPEQIMISYVPLKPYSQLWDIYSEAFDGFDAEIETETQEDYEYNMEER